MKSIAGPRKAANTAKKKSPIKASATTNNRPGSSVLKNTGTTDGTGSTPTIAPRIVLKHDTISYEWRRNSCWLDTSLELMYRCLRRGFADFERILTMVTNDMPLHGIINHLINRYNVFGLDTQRDNFLNDFRERLNTDRDGLRTMLWGRQTTGEIYKFDVLWVSVLTISRPQLVIIIFADLRTTIFFASQWRSARLPSGVFLRSNGYPYRIVPRGRKNFTSSTDK